MAEEKTSVTAQWPVETVLQHRGLPPTARVVESAMPNAALAEARRLAAPVLLSRCIVAAGDFAIVEVEDLAFPRAYVLVTSTYRGATAEVRDLMAHVRDYARIWVR